MSVIYILYIVVCALFLPIVIWGICAQINIQSTYRKFSENPSSGGYTADAVAKLILEKNGLANMDIVQTKGNLTDHYDPRKKHIALSESVFGNTSIAAIGVAAHECGHAVQDKEKYFPMIIRKSLVPVVNLMSAMFVPLMLVGVILQAFSYAFGAWFVYFAIAFYALSTLFYLITLPVEFNASRRALKTIKEMNILTDSELDGARQVLRAAAMTYVVAFLTSLLYFLEFALRILMIVFSSKRK